MFLFLRGTPANVAALSQFFFYLCQIVFGTGDIQSVADGLEIDDFILRFHYETGKSFVCPFQLIIFFEIPLGVFQRCFWQDQRIGSSHSYNGGASNSLDSGSA